MNKFFKWILGANSLQKNKHYAHAKQSFFHISFMYMLGLTQWNLNSLNSNFMIPDFPHNIRIRLAPIEIFVCCVLTLLSLCPVGCLSLAFLNWDSQQGRDVVMSGCNKKISIRPILFLYYEESLHCNHIRCKNYTF